MAEAQRAIEMRKVTTVVETPVVDLRLSIEEAQFLVFVMARIGGHDVKSRRRYADSISKALYPIVPGRQWADRSDVDYNEGGAGSIYFKDEVDG